MDDLDDHYKTTEWLNRGDIGVCWWDELSAPINSTYRHWLILITVSGSNEFHSQKSATIFQIKQQLFEMCDSLSVL